NVLYLPEAVYTVLNYGTAGTDTIVIDLSGYDLSEYDFSSYTVIAHAYARPGSTENVKKLDVDNGPVTIDTKYEKPVAPDVPDTGKILGDLKISTVDYWIFGLGVVGVSAAFAYHQMNKRRR
ncbi:MAG: hypothetical protein Q4F60_02465, partial [Candidatus Saccharibacteria bacterium]|nr:hypothetical protein [Candidatus Saccharibacteria bacterium]